jgi:DNA-binding transcriptional LysR family regulator
VEVELTESGNDAELLALLERADLDLSFTVLPLPEGPFDVVELMTDPYVLMVAADDPLAAEDRPPVLADLEGRPLIGFRHCLSGEFVDAHIRRHGVDLEIVFRSDDNGTVQGLVGAGMASALVPLLAADAADERVAVLPMGTAVPSRRIALAWHRDRALSAASQAFIECARRVCAELQPGVAASSGVV